MFISFFIFFILKKYMMLYNLYGNSLYGNKKIEFRNNKNKWYELWEKVKKIANLNEEQYNRGLNNNYVVFKREEADEMAIKLLKYCISNEDNKSNLYNFAIFCQYSNGFVIGYD
jgi:hypothetical protein